MQPQYELNPRCPFFKESYSRDRFVEIRSSRFARVYISNATQARAVKVAVIGSVVRITARVEKKWSQSCEKARAIAHESEVQRQDSATPASPIVQFMQAAMFAPPLQ